MPLYEIDRLDAEPNLQQFSVLKVIVLITCCITYVLHGITTCLGCPGINLQPLFVFLYIIFEIVSFVPVIKVKLVYRNYGEEMEIANMK